MNELERSRDFIQVVLAEGGARLTTRISAKKQQKFICELDELASMEFPVAILDMQAISVEYNALSAKPNIGEWFKNKLASYKDERNKHTTVVLTNCQCMDDKMQSAVNAMLYLSFPCHKVHQLWLLTENSDLTHYKNPIDTDGFIKVFREYVDLPREYLDGMLSPNSNTLQSDQSDLEGDIEKSIE